MWAVLWLRAMVHSWGFVSCRHYSFPLDHDGTGGSGGVILCPSKGAEDGKSSLIMIDEIYTEPDREYGREWLHSIPIVSYNVSLKRKNSQPAS
jgi:hypothetical protein